jgi:hypothetical protein
MFAKAPLKEPTGVRAAETMTTSVIFIHSLEKFFARGCAAFAGARHLLRCSNQQNVIAAPQHPPGTMPAAALSEREGDVILPKAPSC